MRYGWSLSTLAGVLATAASGQRHLYTFSGQNPADWFGYYVAAAGDVNKDGHADVIAGALFHDKNGTNAGMARVLSGRDGRALFTFHGDGAGDFFGISVRGAGDVNRDGWPDLIVGASQEDAAAGSGYARVFSGKDGRTLHTFRGRSTGDWFGYNVSGARDVDRDGYDDLIVGAPHASPSGFRSGAAYVFSGKDGKQIFSFAGRAAGHLLGNAVKGVGDVDRDGWPDLAAGALLDDRGGKDAGSVSVFSGKDGTLLRALTGSAGDWYGFAVGAPGDIDQDGHADLVVGAPFTSRNGQWSGAVHVISGKDGRRVRSFYGDSAGDGLGRAVSGAGDVDRDGWPDVVGGAHGDTPNGIASGAAFVWSGKTGVLLFRLDGHATNDQFGVACAGAGDVNADGWADVAVGARLDDDGGMDAGTVRIASGRVLPLQTDTHQVSLSRGGSQQFTLTAGVAHAGDFYVLLGSISGTRPGLRLGVVTLPLNPDAWFGFTAGHPEAVIVRARRLLDPGGRGVARLQLPRGLPLSLAGTRMDHAFLVVGLSPLSFRAASNPVPLTLVR